MHLRPAPVVARVATATGVYRPGAATLRREVAVGLHLAAAGAPAVAPSRELPPGPHSRGGLVLSFWEHLEVVAPEPDARAAGAALRELHEALATFPAAELEPFARPLEASRMVPMLTIDEADAAMLAHATKSSLAAVAELGLPLQPLHGDAHLRNVLTTAAGPLWIDLEDTFFGPVGWDLACLVTLGREFGGEAGPGEAALEEHGGALPDELVRLRAVQIVVWTVAMAHRIPSLRERAESSLRWARERFGP